MTGLLSVKQNARTPAGDIFLSSTFRELHKNISIDPGGSAIEVFKRMANHKGLVASNSTFSFWAGILGGINNFSIPYYWMKNVKSSLIGLEDIYRYKCEL